MNDLYDLVLGTTNPRVTRALELLDACCTVIDSDNYGDDLLDELAVLLAAPDRITPVDDHYDLGDPKLLRRDGSSDHLHALLGRNREEETKVQGEAALEEEDSSAQGRLR